MALYRPAQSTYLKKIRDSIALVLTAPGGRRGVVFCGVVDSQNVARRVAVIASESGRKLNGNSRSHKAFS